MGFLTGKKSIVLVILIITLQVSYGQTSAVTNGFKFNSIELKGLDIIIIKNESFSATQSLTEFYFLTRFPLTGKLNILLGPKLDIYRKMSTGESNFGLLFSSGVDYYPKSNVGIHALYNQRVNELPSSFIHYNTFNKQSFTIGTNVKF